VFHRIRMIMWFTWMVHECPLAVGLLDLLLGGGAIHAQDLVEIFSLALLQLQLGGLQEVLVLCR